MNRVITGIVILLTLVASPLAQGARPDFSGRWIAVNLVDGKEVIEETVVVTQTAKDLTLQSYASNGRPGERAARFVFGASTTQPTPPGTEGIAMATWKGNTLVVVVTMKMRGELRGTSEQTWSLDTAGNFVIDSTRRRVGEPAETGRRIFKRP